MTPRLPTPPRLLAILVFLLACGEKRPQPRTVYRTTILNVRGGVTIDRDGVRLEIDGARFDQFQEFDLGGHNEERRMVEGHPLLLEGGRLRLGETDYGEVGVGDVVRMTAEGVIVNGTLRGPFPASRPAR